MADLAAPVLRRFMTEVPDALLLHPGPAGIRVDRRRKGRTEPVGTLPETATAGALQTLLGRRGRREPFVLTLASPLLICEAVLPSAARGSLDKVLRYEMDRLTPFEADDVFFSHRLLGTDNGGATLRVELALVPRTRVQPMFDRLAQYGIVASVLEAAGPNGAVRRIGIARIDAVRQSLDRLLLRLAAVACVVLTCAVIATPLVQQSLAMAEVDDAIAALRPRVNEVEALRQRIAQGSAGAGRIAAAREQAGTVLQMLGVLTATLPDDTWLSSLTLHQRDLVLEGHSTASAKVIAGMAAEPRLHDPAFGAPVLRGESGSEVFTIRARFGL